jgi:hypothetical protein
MAKLSASALRRRPLRQKRHLLQTLRDLKKENPSKAAQIDQILNDEDALDQLGERVEAKAQATGSLELINALDTEQPRQRGAILRWLWANRSDILKFIKEIAAVLPTLGIMSVKKPKKKKVVKKETPHFDSDKTKLSQSPQ